MNHRAPVGIALVCAALAACGLNEKPTPVPIPGEATDINHVVFAGGMAYQTDFELEVAFPANPVLDLYMKELKEPWVRCEWSGPGWESFIDGTATPHQRVHQQLHMWVNRDSQRTLMLATRYYSSEDCASTPDNNNQRVVIVENLHQDVEDTISKLKLKCPAKELRSSSALHPDAREAAVPCKGRSARVGERGR